MRKVCVRHRTGPLGGITGLALAIALAVAPVSAHPPFPQCKAAPAYASAYQLVSAFRPAIYQIQTYGREYLPEVDARYAESSLFKDTRHCPANSAKLKSANAKDCWKPGGNAVLVDGAGYFITVSHNLFYGLDRDNPIFFKGLPIRDVPKRTLDDLAKTPKDRRWHSELAGVAGKAGPVVRLVGPRGRIYAVEEIMFGSPHTACTKDVRDDRGDAGDNCLRRIDFSILKIRDEDLGALAKDMAAHAAVPELFLGEPFADPNSSRLTLVAINAHQSADAEPDQFEQDFDWSSIIKDLGPENESDYLITRGWSVPGNSGGPAFDEKGRLRGLLRGPYSAANDALRKLTRLGAVKDFLARTPVEKNSLAERLMNALNGDSAPEAKSEARAAIGDALAGELGALDTLRILTPVIADWRAARDGVLPQPQRYRVGLRDFDMAVALLNAATCNFLTGESFTLIEAIAAANRPFGSDPTAGEVVFGPAGPERRARDAQILSMVNRLSDSVEAAGRADPADELTAERSRLAALYSTMLEGSEFLEPSAAVADALPRYGLTLAASGGDAATILSLAHRSLETAPRDWRSAALAAHALWSRGFERDSREMALVGLALTEEAETYYLQSNRHVEAEAARALRKHLRQTLPALAPLTSRSIGEQSIGLVARYEGGMLASTARLNALAHAAAN